MIRAAGVLFYCTATNRVLLGRSSDKYTWSPFGGKADDGESISTAARREVGEETGFFGDYVLVPIFQNKLPGVRHDTYLAKVDYEFQCNTNFETAEWGWFDLDDLPTPLHPGFRRCLQKNSKMLLGMSQSLNEWEVPSAPQGAPDPARMTLKEYYALVNPDRKSHPSSAYDVDLASLNRYSGRNEDDKVVRRLKVRGLNFVVYASRDKNSYAKQDEDGEYIRENGKLVFFSDEEVLNMGKALYSYSFYIVNDEDQRVASFQDEWGTVLIMVAKEYRGFGFGPLLTQIGRTVYPDKTSGGFTTAGSKNFAKVHRMFVSRALNRGDYRRWVMAGEMTVERVKDIVQSTGPRTRISQDSLSSNDPDNWLLYHEYGAFILYDKKLADHYDDDDIFTEKMTKGMAYVREYSNYGIIDCVGVNDKITNFLLKCAITFCRRNNIVPLIDEDVDRTKFTKDIRVEEPDVSSGMRRREISWDGKIDYDALVRLEQRWRKSFDQYDEFKYNMLERGESMRR